MGGLQALFYGVLYALGYAGLKFVECGQGRWKDKKCVQKYPETYVLSLVVSEKKETCLSCVMCRTFKKKKKKKEDKFLNHVSLLKNFIPSIKTMMRKTELTAPCNCICLRLCFHLYQILRELLLLLYTVM